MINGVLLYKNVFFFVHTNGISRIKGDSTFVTNTTKNVELEL